MAAFMGLTAEPHQLDVSLDDVKVWTGSIGGPRVRRNVAAEPARPHESRSNKKIARGAAVPRAGEGRLASGSGVLRRTKTTAYVEDLFDPSMRRDPYRAGNGEPGVSTCDDHRPSPRHGGRSQRFAEPPHGCWCASLRRPADEAPAPGRSSRRSRGARIGGR